MTVDDIIRGIEEGIQHDGGANYITMLEGMGLLGNIFSILTGLMVSVIIIGMPIIIAIEVMYLNLPFIQGKFDNLLIKTSGKKHDALEFTIKDAKRALIAANTVETGRSVNRIYLSIKIKAVFIAALIIGLVLGVGPAVLSFLWKLVTSVFEGFKLSI